MVSLVCGFRPRLSRDTAEFRKLRPLKPWFTAFDPAWGLTCSPRAVLTPCSDCCREACGPRKGSGWRSATSKSECWKLGFAFKKARNNVPGMRTRHLTWCNTEPMTTCCPARKRRATEQAAEEHILPSRKRRPFQTAPSMTRCSHRFTTPATAPLSTSAIRHGATEHCFPSMPTPTSPPPTPVPSTRPKGNGRIKRLLFLRRSATNSPIGTTTKEAMRWTMPCSRRETARCVFLLLNRGRPAPLRTPAYRPARATVLPAARSKTQGLTGDPRITTAPCT